MPETINAPGPNPRNQAFVRKLRRTLAATLANLRELQSIIDDNADEFGKALTADDFVGDLSDISPEEVAYAITIVQSVAGGLDAGEGEYRKLCKRVADYQ